MRRKEFFFLNFFFQQCNTLNKIFRVFTYFLAPQKRVLLFESWSLAFKKTEEGDKNHHHHHHHHRFDATFIYYLLCVRTNISDDDDDGDDGDDDAS